jgi:hypothetical protein
MRYSKAARAYIDSEHIRFLGENNQVPTLEERVMAAFDAGFRYFIVETTEPDKDTINFPNWNE